MGRFVRSVREQVLGSAHVAEQRFGISPGGGARAGVRDGFELQFGSDRRGVVCCPSGVRSASAGLAGQMAAAVAPLPGAWPCSRFREPVLSVGGFLPGS